MQNDDGALFCKNCGAKLGTSAGTSPTATSQKPNQPAAIPVQAKVPFIAAFLNLFFGIGYFYLGYKKILGLQTVLFVILAFALYLIGFFFTYGLLTVIVAILFTIDGFQKADGEKGIFSAE